MLTTVTIECDLPDGYEAVAWRVPKDGELYYSLSTSGARVASSATLMGMILRKIEPRRVPLEAKDVPPGSAVRATSGGCWQMVTFAGGSHIGIANGLSENYGVMMTLGWQILRPDGEWEPCSKMEVK